MKIRISLLFVILLLTVSVAGAQQKEISTSGNLRNQTWTSDNGNGTFTNPLFYDEFSDPDLIRVDDDFYLTGTTMHAMPGLPVLHSKDLVNWDFLCYASERLDMGPEFRLEEDKDIYGQGIWAPSFRYNNGIYYIFTNVNHYGSQVYTATNPAGPWEHYKLNATLHDLSVLFDDDGKIYAIWGYNEIHMVELKSDVSGIIPETEKIIIPKDQGAGEGSHFYKIDGKYFITLTMPGLPVLHSKDLVNWDFLCYASERLDMGPEFRLEEDKDIYGQGIWAPSFRYNNGIYYIFTNVNHYGSQVYTATNPAGPWEHYKLNATLHDLSVLFDDDGKIYAIWGYNEIHMVELKSDVSGIIPETEKIIIPKDQGAGEGSHFYKIDGKYFITLTNYDPLCYQVTARADKPEGPYEIEVTSAEENLGVATTYRMPRVSLGPPFDIIKSDKNFVGCIPMHLSL